MRISKGRVLGCKRILSFVPSLLIDCRTRVSQKRLRTSPLRTAKLLECMSLELECLQGLEPYSFLMSLSYYGSEIRRYVGGRD